MWMLVKINCGHVLHVYISATKTTRQMSFCLFKAYFVCSSACIGWIIILRHTFTDYFLPEALNVFKQ